MARNYYETLGVPSTASKQEIKKAYQKLAKQWHPDVNKAAHAEAKFKEVTEAYDILSHDKRRQQYDDQLNYQANRNKYTEDERSSRSRSADSGSRTQSEHSTGSSGTGPNFMEEDLFDVFFGDRMSGYEFFNQAASNFSNKTASSGNSLRTTRAKLNITLEQSYRGEQIPVQLSGKKIHVKIPDRIGHDRTIRIVGTGSNGIAAGEELLITLYILPHAMYKVEGKHLYGTLQIAPWEAVLGSEARISLPDYAQVRIKIPAGIQSGRQLRISGKGLREEEGIYGDLILTIEINVPAALSERERQLYEELASTSNYRAHIKWQ